MKRKDIYHFDERRNIVFPGDDKQTIDFAVKHFIEAGQKAIEEKGRFVVALSGGSTPKKIYQTLSKPHYREALNWKDVFIFWGDERSVPPTDKDSNYHMAMTCGLDKLNIPKENIHRMPADRKDRDEAAKEYEKVIRETLAGNNFDYVMLGMGPDGHTASLFPDTKALSVSEKWVVPNEVPQKSTWRMTFTYPLINSADHIVFYIMGEEKREMLANVLFDEENKFPAARIGSARHPALWIVEEKASERLLKEWSPEDRSSNAI